MIGIDLVSISRIKQSIENTAFVKRVFSAVEQNYCNKKADSAQSYAGLFCAKEAAVKALGIGFGSGIAPTDIVVTHTSNGAPSLKFFRKAIELFKPYICSVSISHDGDYAVATVELIAKGENK